MPLFDKTPFSYDILREGEEIILQINCETYTKMPSIEDDPLTMQKTVDILNEVGAITKIAFFQRRRIEYDFSQVNLLREIAVIYKKIIKQRETLGYNAFVYDPQCTKCVTGWYTEIRNLITDTLRSDPISTYVELRRIIRDETIKRDKATDPRCVRCEQKYIDLLSGISGMLENTQILAMAKPHLAGFKVGTRDLYRMIFKPLIKPDFLFTKLMSKFPEEGEELDSYMVNETEVTIFKVPDTIQYLYHISPPEFRLSEDQYEILDSARKIMTEHKPKRSEFVDPERMRSVFFNIGHDLIEELADFKKIRLKEKEIDELTKILVRYTVGFGLIEVLLEDENIQDITINSPMGEIPIFLVHAEFGDCRTNIIPTVTEADSWASKLRMISGRPLDEANPILDAELILPDARSRVAVISSPLNPSGLAYAFRRHRDKPWTLPLFIHNRMLNPLGAGLLSFIIDGSRTMLVAGTRSAGKTSLLGGILTEIMRKFRVITIEDTLELPGESLRKLGYNIQQMKVAAAMTKSTSEVSAEEGIRTTLRMGDSCLIVGEVRSSLRGDQEVLVIQDGLTKRVAIKSLENLDLKSVYLPTLTSQNTMEIKPITGFVKHPKRNRLIKLTTKTGRSVIVTPDHSVFTHVNFKIAAINTDKLKPGDPIIIPSKLPNNFNDIDHIDLLKIFKENYRLEHAEPYLRKAIKILGWAKASKICGVADIYRYLLSTQKTRIPIGSFLKLMGEAKIKYNISDLRITKGSANSIPAKFPINENVMRLIGYYLAEGNIGKDKIQVTNSKPSIIEDVKYICEKEFGLNVSQRKITGYGSSVQMFIISKPLRDLLIYLGCGKTSFYKRIPEFVYGLNKRKICALLKGMYSGDGSISSSVAAGNMIRYFSTSKKLIEDVSFALLSLGIVTRIGKRAPGKDGKKILFVAEIKQRKYVECFLENIGFTHKKPSILMRSFAHSKDDSVSFDPKELENHIKLIRKYRHLRRTRSCSKEYLRKITEEVKCSDELYNFAHGDFFIDKVRSIETIDLKEPENVYDLEVISTQRFIGGFGGILLHNTEARSLYEAMRVGALANVVAGTIHGDSPYGVFDRVVNDLNVPRTSFKATDIIVVANPIRSADGMHRWRRITQITEVRKHWDQDPLLENGFCDLMKYDSKSDELEPSQDMINGESEILKSIAGSVKEWAGNWDAVWDNILLRTKIKEALVNIAEKQNDLSLLEAPFVIQSNDEFHRISDTVRDEVGSLDSKRIFFEWNEWLKRSVKKKHL
ncbi:MAG TPA: ATPase, T2SS/T4P/T4SS family [Candidatus Nanoarchaeia archaeon]|nr:ATPase, T2SS/T4P/T4SS family [Candidatus Nanoarchaeia archaeon]